MMTVRVLNLIILFLKYGRLNYINVWKVMFITRLLYYGTFHGKILNCQTLLSYR